MARKFALILLTMSFLLLLNGCLGIKKLVVSGSSMEPTIKSNEEALVDYDYYKSSKMQRGDIVLLKLESSLTQSDEIITVKRIIGLPGEKVELRDGKVYIDDKELKEDYLPDNSVTVQIKETKWDIPENNVFILGDNRGPGASLDSRYLGPIPEESIEGFVILKKK